MSHEEDRSAALLWEKVRVASIVVALVLLVASLVTDMTWLHYPRAVAWFVAGYAAFREGRAYKRLGRDPDAMYLRAAGCVVAGVLCVL